MSELPLAAAVGQRMRAVRDKVGVTADRVAQSAHGFGFGWQRSTVASVETGRRGLSAEELVALPLILTDATDGRTNVTLVELIGDGGALAANLNVTPLGVDELVGQRAFTTAGWRQPQTARRNREQLEAHPGILDDLGLLMGQPGTILAQIGGVMQAAAGEAEQKAARRLGCSALALSACAHSLWGHGLTDERGRREQLLDELPPGNDAAARTRRGHITRSLMADIREALGEETARDGQR